MYFKRSQKYSISYNLLKFRQKLSKQSSHSSTHKIVKFKLENLEITFLR